MRFSISLLAALLSFGSLAHAVRAPEGPRSLRDCQAIQNAGEKMMSEGQRLKTKKATRAQGLQLIATGQDLVAQGKTCKANLSKPSTDCDSAIAAGQSMVSAGNALLPNPATVPMGNALIAAGMAQIAAGMACNDAKDAALVPNKNQCEQLKGNWNKAGGYCYFMNSQQGMGVSQTENKQIEACEKSGKAWNSAAKFCFSVYVPKTNSCAPGKVPVIISVDHTGQTGFSCAPVGYLKCIVNGSSKSANQPSALCKRPDGAPTLSPNLMTNIKLVDKPIPLPLQPVATNTNTSTTTTTTTATYTAANGHTIVVTHVSTYVPGYAGPTTQTNTSQNTNTGVVIDGGGVWSAGKDGESIDAIVDITYENEEDCVAKLERLNRLNARVVLENEVEAHCRVFMDKPREAEQLPKSDRLQYKMHFADKAQCLANWTEAKTVPTIELRFAGFDANAESELVCKRLFPAAVDVPNAFALAYTYRNKNAQNQGWGVADPIVNASGGSVIVPKPIPTPDNQDVWQSMINMRATHICNAIDEAERISKNPELFLEKDHYAKINILGYVVFRNGQGQCRLGKTEQRDFDKLPACSPCATTQ